MAFDIVLTEEAKRHLRAFRKYEQQTILDQIEVQLKHEPDVPTRNRQRLEDNPIAPWKVRIGDFRVFYDCDRETNEVIVHAIGEKVRSRLLIGGEEVVL